MLEKPPLLSISCLMDEWLHVCANIDRLAFLSPHSGTSPEVVEKLGISHVKVSTTTSY